MKVCIFNRQRKVTFALPRLKTSFLAALPLCTSASPASGNRGTWDEVSLLECSVLSDTGIARVHRLHCGIPGPTDVITFPHGEILLGAGTIQTNAAAFGHSIEQELLLCLIHGVLHLRGFGDHEATERREMHRVQQEILEAAWNLSC